MTTSVLMKIEINNIKNGRMCMGHIAPAINKVPHGHGTYSPCNK
jgi:hypothetical protein